MSASKNWPRWAELPPLVRGQIRRACRRPGDGSSELRGRDSPRVSHPGWRSPFVDLLTVLASVGDTEIDFDSLLADQAVTACVEPGALNAVLAALTGFWLAGGLAEVPPETQADRCGQAHAWPQRTELAAAPARCPLAAAVYQN
ncbi:MAG TPA: hypothetical protein VME44_00890 [Streptosporangiaceae bacterium]|nr:hypothetical protein [Streptosporangiaceae bacterium]